MRDGEVCVCFFAEALATNNPKISRHLAYLKRASLVVGRRQGKWMHYRINAPKERKVAEVFAATLEMLKDDPQMQADREKLTGVCAPGVVSIDRKGRKVDDLCNA